MGRALARTALSFLLLSIHAKCERIYDILSHVRLSGAREAMGSNGKHMPGGGLADLVADAELEKAAAGARRPNSQ